MEKTISATDAVRKFSEILSSVKYKGDRYTIKRGGKAVAFISPALPSSKTLGELKVLLKQLPPLGEEAEGFKKDLSEIIRHQPLTPEKDRWA